MTQLMSVRAVVVGIDDYKDPRLLTSKLKYAVADAQAVGRAIDQSTAFKVEKLAIFTNETAAHWQVWRSLNEVFPPHLNFDSNTIAIFYFAGHGMKDPIEGERIYLGCNDVEVANPMKGGIPLSNIYNLLLQSSAGCSMAIIDACFSGAIMDLKRIEHESPAELARREIGALRGADDKTVAIFAACRSEQSAREDDERKHGIYTDELLQGWRDGKARDEEGKVHILDLAAYLTKLFEYDEQTPRSNVLSGRSIIIWQHDPPASDTALTLPKPLPLRKLTDGKTSGYQIEVDKSRKSTQQYLYDVALSYAGEDHNYAEALANALKQHKIKVFFDKYEKHVLWGKNLYTYLSDLYQNRARYCVIFISQHYAVKLWTSHEREAAQARAFKQQEAYILPIRLDETHIPGLLPTVAYLDWHQETVETITNILLQKLALPDLTEEE